MFERLCNHNHLQINDYGQINFISVFLFHKIMQIKDFNIKDICIEEVDSLWGLDRTHDLRHTTRYKKNKHSIEVIQ